jgi:PAS domain S-box-containing protein
MRAERERAEESLRRSDACLAEAQRLSRTGSFGWRVSNGEILWSEETFRIFQCDPTTKPTVELIVQRTHPEDRALVQQTIERAARDGKDFDFEHRLLMPDGSIKHVHVVAHAESDESGEFEFVGAVMDVTEQHQARTALEEAFAELKKSQDRLRLVIDTIPAHVWTAQPDGSVDFLNQRWLEFHGVSLAEAKDWGWRVLVHPDDLATVEETWRAAVAAGLPYEHEVRVRTAGGAYQWFLARGVPLRDENGHIVKWYGTLHDIEDKKQAEENLRRSEAYLAEAQRLTHIGSWVYNIAAGDRTYTSDEFCRLYGFDPEKGVPPYREFRQRIHREDLDRVVETYERGVGERTDFEIDYRIVLPDGTIKYLHAIAHPVINAAGDLIEFVGTVMDVTERKRAEEELRAAEQVTRGQVEALAQSLDVLATAPAPDQFIGQMLGTICRQLNGQSVELFLFDEASESLVLRLVVEGETLAPSDSQYPLVRDPALWKENRVVKDLIFAGAPVVIEDIETDPRVPVAVRKYLKSGGTKKSLGVPILAGGKVKGVVGVRHGDRPPYRREEIELMQALAHQVMLALRLTELAEQSRGAAILEERNRMARDIHDTLAQGFTGVIMQLEAAEKAIERRRPKLVDEYLQRAGKLARQSLSEARRSVHALRPEALKEGTFWDALQAMIKSITVGTALHPSFKAQGKVDQLPPVWQENLLHIGQEALANTIKYAHAHKFGTRLIYDAKQLRLEFSDDGDGFKLQDRHDGSGLAGMRERVEQMGGELKITSSRGKGTKISVVLPYNGESML